LKVLLSHKEERNVFAQKCVEMETVMLSGIWKAQKNIMFSFILGI
jgi:hypothetical protein